MKINPSNKELYTDSGTFLKRLHCPISVMWKDMSENGSNSVGVDQDEDVPETLSDENNGMYHQMNLKDATNSNTNTRETTAPVE